MRSLASTGFCLICHCNGDKHSPVNCPLLAVLNLKLVKGPPPAAAPALGPPGHVTAASPSPGGHSAVADRASASGMSGSVDVPLGLVATVADKEYDLGDDFCWEGDETVMALQALLPLGVTLTTMLPSTHLAFMQLSRPLLTSWFLKILHQCALRVAPPLCPLFPGCITLSSHAHSAPSLHACLLLPFSQAPVVVLLSQTHVLLIICFWQVYFHLLQIGDQTPSQNG